MRKEIACLIMVKLLKKEKKKEKKLQKYKLN